MPFEPPAPISGGFLGFGLGHVAATRRAAFADLTCIVAPMAGQLDEVRMVTEQLEPERARSCRNAITMASVMVDEIRLRAYARPLDEPEP